MSTGGLRERNKARTREEILGAALGLFETKGYDETTCEDIAAAAGVSARTFFRYFDAKVDVLFAGRSDDTGPFAVIAELLERPATEDPVEAVRQSIQHNPIAVLESQRDLVLRQFRVMMTTPSLATLQLEQFHRFEPQLAAAIAQRTGRRPEDPAARLLAAATACALRLSIERWVASGANPAALRPLVDEAFDLLADGFAALTD